MKIPPLHRQSYDEAADKEKDDVIELQGCNRFPLHNSEKWKKHDRE